MEKLKQYFSCFKLMLCTIVFFVTFLVFKQIKAVTVILCQQLEELCVLLVKLKYLYIICKIEALIQAGLGLPKQTQSAMKM